ncbi:MAG: 2-C-methyl-D-erythritol 2,4-cyclodiphosphate synthase [Lentisphaeria bacterium]|jgi:2-C-methyl-D-erythritol 2,4-cyclodiphosphate synthase|nr:2-C-methyl-D-erythritol 2,4-cyclodiphosphate synthase [Lentisphaeria bacterium]
MIFRIGQGYDLHRCVAGRPLVLGGVTIPCAWGLDGHSDADALLHAITDAVLGALALDDIGAWFPDHDPHWKNADSATLLRQVLNDPRLHGWRLGNLDCTVITEKPKLAPFRQPIRQSIAAIFSCTTEKISFKAKTNEHQDAIGQGLALAAQAVVLMQGDDDAHLAPDGENHA